MHHRHEPPQRGAWTTHCHQRRRQPSTRHAPELPTRPQCGQPGQDASTARHRIPGIVLLPTSTTGASPRGAAATQQHRRRRERSTGARPCRTSRLPTDGETERGGGMCSWSPRGPHALWRGGSSGTAEQRSIELKRRGRVGRRSFLLPSCSGPAGEASKFAFDRHAGRQRRAGGQRTEPQHRRPQRRRGAGQQRRPASTLKHVGGLGK